MSCIGGMVLAAGTSERMDGSLPKQLLPLHRSTMVAVTVGNATASLLQRVVVVTGFRSADVAAAVGENRAEVAHNPEYRTGNMSSFRVGASALAGCDAVVVLLADMPGVTTAMIDNVVAEWNRSRPWAGVAVYDDGPAHPLLLSAAAVDEAVAVEGPKGLWRFLDAAPPDKVMPIRLSGPVPTDVNTSGDYEQVRRDCRSSR